MRMPDFSFPRIAVAALALGVAVAGCGGSEGGTDPVDPVDPIIATRLAFEVQPTAATAGSPITPAIQVRAVDADGRVATSFAGSVTLSLGPGSSGATLSGTFTAAAVAGVATFADLRIERSGEGYTLIAASGSLTSATSTAFTVAPGNPSKLVLTQQPTDVQAMQPIGPAVEVAVQDAYGNLVSNATNSVTLALETNPWGATLSGGAAQPAVNGVATFGDLRADRPGPGYTLRATGDALEAATSDPFAVSVSFVAVSAGSTHTCGVTNAGLAYCWGSNSTGQLGDGTGQNSLTPALVSGGYTWVSVRAGNGHTCGSTGGKAYCWGLGGNGQLGSGGSQNTLIPTEVTSLFFAEGGVAAVDAGGRHSCGVAGSGTALCWGLNQYGALGNGTLSPATRPVPVVGGLSFAALSAGALHTCGLTPGAFVYCWGRNQFGQLGDGSVVDRPEATLILGVTREVTTGSAHSCALPLSTNDIYCWGNNDSGQIGDGTRGINRTSPKYVGSNFSAVTAGGLHTCALGLDRRAYCWGSAPLGDGTNTDRPTPTPVQGTLRFNTLSAGGLHTCGVTTSGEVYCWGSNADGQLGDNSTLNALAPTRVIH